MFNCSHHKDLFHVPRQNLPVSTASCPVHRVQEVASPSLLLLLRYWKAGSPLLSFLFPRLDGPNFFKIFSYVYFTLVFMSFEQKVDQNWALYFMSGLTNHTLSPAVDILTDSCSKHRVCCKGSQLTHVQLAPHSPLGLFKSVYIPDIHPPGVTAVWDFSNRGARICISLW